MRPHLSGDDHRVRAFLAFAAEEAKHIPLFRRFREEFRATLGALSPAALARVDAAAKSYLPPARPASAAA